VASGTSRITNPQSASDWLMVAMGNLDYTGALRHANDSRMIEETVDARGRVAIALGRRMLHNRLRRRGPQRPPFQEEQPFRQGGQHGRQ
jgi:hypothetical protein